MALKHPFQTALFQNTLISCNSMITSTEGDLGDAVFQLCALKNLSGGPHTLLFELSDSTKAKTPESLERMANCFAPLALSQPYISECRIKRPEDKVRWASAGFRKAPYHHGQTLLKAHVNHLVMTQGIGKEITGTEKWLEVEPEHHGYDVVINRTGRHRNPNFPWAAVVRHFSYRILFIGLDYEWKEFCAHYGYVDFQPTSNLLEAARIIAGSKLFIGNQSVANAIAEGMKHNLVQETSLVHPDCIFARPNATHCADGGLRLQMEDMDPLTVDPIKFNYRCYDVNRQPKDGWFFDGCFVGSNWRTATENAQRMRSGKSLTDVEDELLEQQAHRLPSLFGKACTHNLGAFFAAQQNALKTKKNQ